MIQLVERTWLLVLKLQMIRDPKISKKKQKNFFSALAYGFIQWNFIDIQGLDFANFAWGVVGLGPNFIYPARVEKGHYISSL